MRVWWPRWVKRGWCFDTAPQVGLFLVVEYEDGLEILECGHRVTPVFPIASAPLMTYRRTCPHCSEVEGDDLFFPRKGGLSYEQAREAKAVCNGDATHAPCPVRTQCLEYAVHHGIRHGVWGGASQRERAIIGREEDREAS